MPSNVHIVHALEYRCELTIERKEEEKIEKTTDIHPYVHSPIALEARLVQLSGRIVLSVLNAHLS